MSFQDLLRELEEGRAVKIVIDGDGASILRQIVGSAAPKAKESVKWAQPVYEDNGPFAHIRTFTPPHSYGAPYTIL